VQAANFGNTRLFSSGIKLQISKKVYFNNR